MSVQAITWALEQTTEQPVDKLILIALGNYADDQDQCYPSRKTIARIAMCSVDTVDRGLRRLEDAGLVSKETRLGARGQTSNVYQLNVNPSRNLRPAPAAQVQRGEPQSAAGGAASRCGGGSRNHAAPISEPLLEPSLNRESERAREGLIETEEAIAHRGFVISLPAIEMAVIRSGLPKDEIRTRCKAHALQWAAEIDAGKMPRDVVPQKVVNFLASTIMGEVNRDSRPIHRATAKPTAATRTETAMNVLKRMREELAEREMAQ